MERCSVRTAIDGHDPNENVFDVCLRILDKDIEVAVLGKNPGIEQFEFGLGPTAASVFLDQQLVRELGLGIFVQHAHVAVGRSGVKIEVALLHVLAVIPLISRQPKEAFFENGVAAIPKREPEAHHLMAVADAADSVFAPAISTRTGMVMRKVFPGSAVGAVIFADRAPLALGKIRSPALPVLLAQASFLKTLVFLS